MAASNCIRFTALLLWTFAALASPSVKYLPTNTEEHRGIVFFFAEANASRATITVEAIGCDGKVITSTQDIDTDREHGERLVFEMGDLDPDHMHELIRVTIRMGNRAWAIDHPRSSVWYPLSATQP